MKTHRKVWVGKEREGHLAPAPLAVGRDATHQTRLITSLISPADAVPPVLMKNKRAAELSSAFLKKELCSSPRYWEDPQDQLCAGTLQSPLHLH